MPQTRESGFHALRHHFASVLPVNGSDIRALATYLGHTDPGFTLRIYTHLMSNAADRMRAAVDHVLATGGADGPRVRCWPRSGAQYGEGWLAMMARLVILASRTAK